MTRAPSAIVAVAFGVGLAAAAAPAGDPSPARVAPLWVSPDDLAQRDLFTGPGGPAAAPHPGDVYRFSSADTSGHSKGYRVVGPDGRKWKIKVGDEVSSEIAASRILWAIGYHQPSLYYVPEWSMTGGPKIKPRPGRFRLDSDHNVHGNWAFDDNPFVGTRALAGLVVANVLLNNWDMAPSNNRIYRAKGRHGAGVEVYVTQDLGASFGKTRLPLGTRNKIDDFESQEFVTGIQHGRPVFDYHGLHKKLLEGVTADDVAWVCGMLARLSDRQLDDAFRAAGYPDDLRARFVKKLKSKIAQGLALGPTAEEKR